MKRFSCLLFSNSTGVIADGRWCWVMSSDGSPSSEYRRARANYACSRCGWGCLGIFLSSIEGWTGGAMGLGILPVPGRPTGNRTLRPQTISAPRHLGP